jgi:hypothetical protein
MASNKTSKTVFSTPQRNPHIILRPTKRAITAVPRNIKVKEMNSITIFRHHLSKLAKKMKKNIMKKIKLRTKKMMKKRSHPSSFTTFTKKTMI